MRLKALTSPTIQTTLSARLGDVAVEGRPSKADRPEQHAETHLDREPDERAQHPPVVDGADDGHEHRTAQDPGGWQRRRRRAGHATGSAATITAAPPR